MKIAFNSTAIASLLIASCTYVCAAGTNAQITITGDVVPVTCDVSGGGAGTGGSVDLGNAAATEFTAGTGIYQGLKMVMGNRRNFTVGVGGCSGTVESGKILSLNVLDAQSIPASKYVLGGGAGSTTSTFGSTLEAKKTISDTSSSLLKQGDKVEVFKYTSTDGEAANGSEVQFAATMASVVTPSVGHSVAPVTFSIAYN